MRGRASLTCSPTASEISSWPCRPCPLPCEIHETIVFAQAVGIAAYPLAAFWATRFLHCPSAITNEIGMSIWTRKPVASTTSAFPHGTIDLLALFFCEPLPFSENLFLDRIDATMLALHLFIVARALLNHFSTSGTRLRLNCHMSTALCLLLHVHVQHVQIKDVSAVQLIQLASDFCQAFQTQWALLVLLLALHTSWTWLTTHSLAQMSTI